jgi:hypothetical protein
LQLIIIIIIRLMGELRYSFIIFNSALDGSEWSALGLGCLTPRKEPPIPTG